MDLREQMESIYRESPLERIPWNLEEPPELLVDLIKTRKISPCDGVDIGCGCGNYTVWLAAQGFRMTGMDISPAAVALAGQLAREKGVECRFVEGDVTEGVAGHEGAFDLGYDWEVLHHVFPEKREAYASNLHRMLRPGATHLSVCFSERDPDFGGSGKYRQTPLGTTLYFSSEEEIEGVFSQKFRVVELDTTSIVGNTGPIWRWWLSWSGSEGDDVTRRRGSVKPGGCILPRGMPSPLKIHSSGVARSRSFSRFRLGGGICGRTEPSAVTVTGLRAQRGRSRQRS